MADTGFKTTGAVVSASPWWTNMTTTRINTADNTRATMVGTTFAVATLNNYSFGLASGVTIDGIEVNTEFSTSPALSTATLQISLSWDNGSTYTTAKSDTVSSTTDKNSTMGGATDTWGRTWTDAEFANGTFLVKVEGKSSGFADSCRLDFLQIKVYYTVPSTGASGAYYMFLEA